VRTPPNSYEWRDSLRAIGEVQDREDRERAADLSVSERLARGVALSTFAVRLKEAFRDQSTAS